MAWLAKHKGAITVAALIPIAIAVALSMIGSIGYTTARVDKTDDKVSLQQSDIATLKEAISTIKDDNKEIKADIKLILQKLK